MRVKNAEVPTNVTSLLDGPPKVRHVMTLFLEDASTELYAALKENSDISMCKM